MTPTQVTQSSRKMEVSKKWDGPLVVEVKCLSLRLPPNTPNDRTGSSVSIRIASTIGHFLVLLWSGERRGSNRKEKRLPKGVDVRKPRYPTESTTCPRDERALQKKIRGGRKGPGRETNRVNSSTRPCPKLVLTQGVQGPPGTPTLDPEVVWAGPESHTLNSDPGRHTPALSK